MLDVGLSGFLRRNIGGNVGLGRGDGSLLAGDIRFLLHMLDGGHRLALGYLVSLLHIEMGDAAHGGGAKVNVGLGLDLAGAADNRGQILAHDLGGQNLGIARLLLVDHEGHKSGSHYYSANNQENLFHVRFVLQTSPDSVYAIGPGKVPRGCKNYP